MLLNSQLSYWASSARLLRTVTVAALSQTLMELSVSVQEIPISVEILTESMKLIGLLLLVHQLALKPITLH